MTQIVEYIREFNPWWEGKFKLEYKEREVYQKIKKFLDMPQEKRKKNKRQIPKKFQ